MDKPGFDITSILDFQHAPSNRRATSVPLVGGLCTRSSGTSA